MLIAFKNVDSSDLRIEAKIQQVESVQADKSPAISILSVRSSHPVNWSPDLRHQYIYVKRWLHGSICFLV